MYFLFFPLKAPFGDIWVPKIRGTKLGDPYDKDIVFFGLYCGSSISGYYHTLPQPHFKPKRGPAKTTLLVQRAYLCISMLVDREHGNASIW